MTSCEVENAAGELAGRRFLFTAVGCEVGAKAVNKLFFLLLAAFQVLLKFFQRKMDDVVVVQLFGLNEVAEPQPEAMKQVDLVGSEIRRMRTEDFEDFVPSGHVNFEIELGFGIAEALPGFTDLASLLFALPLAGRTRDDSGRLQALAGAENTIPEIIRSDDGEADGFAAFLGEAEGLREELLLDAAEKLVGVEFLFAGSGTAEDADVKDDDVAAARLDSVEDVGEVIEIVLVADRDKDVAGTGANGFGREFAFNFEIELIHLNVCNASLAGAPLGDSEDDVKKNRKYAACHGCDGFGEEVNDGDEEQGEGDEAEAERDLHAANSEIERNLKITGDGIRVTENENG